MRSRVDPAPRPAASARGFTILEILVVVALLGLIATLFISGASDLFRSQVRSEADLFWQAVQAARLQAVQEDRTVELRYDEEKRQLQWGAAKPYATLGWPGKSVRFLPADSHDSVLLGGQLVDTGKVGSVHFYADGGTDRFRVVWVESDGRSFRLEIDPWTCAPIEPKNP